MQTWRTLLFTAGLCNAATDPPKLSVVFIDHAHLPPRVQAKAEAYYSAVFRRAGIGVDWIHPAAETNVALDNSIVLIRVLSKNQEGPMLRRARGCLGLALANSASQPLGSVLVFYNEIEAAAQGLPSRIPLILGHVMVHETGHLLLGRGHTVTGVMKPSWRGSNFFEVEQGTDIFTPTEGSKMRSKVTARQLRIAGAVPGQEGQTSVDSTIP